MQNQKSYRRVTSLVSKSSSRKLSGLFCVSVLSAGLMSGCEAFDVKNPADGNESDFSTAAAPVESTSVDTAPPEPSEESKPAPSEQPKPETSGEESSESTESSQPSSSQDSSSSSSSSDSSDSTSSSDETTTTTKEPVLEYLVITPLNQIVELDLEASKSLEFRAFGHYSDGSAKDLSDKVDWGVSSDKMGKFEGDKLKLSKHDELYVETSKVTASFNSLKANAQVTVTAYEQDGENPDFVFVLPHNDAKGVAERELSFKTNIPALDVFFAVDATGSMGEEREQLLNSIESTIVPQVQSRIKNSQFGVGSVQDFPIYPNGASGDQPFRLLQKITSEIDKAKEGVKSIEIGNGVDNAEATFEALYQIATGEGLEGPWPTRVPANKEGIGGVGFRKGSIPVVVSITDAVSHVVGEDGDGCGRAYHREVAKVAHTRKQMVDALNKICARVITVASEGSATEPGSKCSPEEDGKQLAKATKARVSPMAWNKNRPTGCAVGQCCTGKDGAGQAPEADGMCSLVFGVNGQGEGLGTSVVSGLEALAFYAPFDVKAESRGSKTSVSGEALPGGASTLDFISSITAESHGALPIADLPKPTAKGQHFEGVTPGTEVRFRIKAFNDVVPQKSEVQVFRAKIGVQADQCEGIELDEREVVFIVPPKPIIAG